MDLKDFVSQTLVQIVEGVVDASERISVLGGSVAPDYTAKLEGTLGRTREGRSLPVQAVEFDVAVVAGNESSTEAGGGLKISVLSLGAKGSDTDRRQTTSRIQFVVPLQLPVDPASTAAREAHDREQRLQAEEADRKIKSARTQARI